MDNSYLQHYGVLGQKWGDRRYQNEDGTLTSAGQKRYEKTGEYGYTYKSHATKKYDRKAAKADKKLGEEINKHINTSVDGNTATHNVTITKKAMKLSDKAAKYQQRADISRQIDKREMEYANSVKAGGNFLVRALTSGVVGGKGYQQHVAMNKKAQDTGNKFIAACLSNFAGGSLGSRLRKAAVIRSNENSMLGNLGRNVGGDNFDYATKEERRRRVSGN